MVLNAFSNSNEHAFQNQFAENIITFRRQRRQILNYFYTLLAGMQYQGVDPSHVIETPWETEASIATIVISQSKRTLLGAGAWAVASINTLPIGVDYLLNEKLSL